MSQLNDEALAWIAKQAAGPLSVSERAAFDVWHNTSPLHQGAYLRAQAIWHTLDKASILAEVRPVLSKGPRSNRRAFLATGLAAGVAAVTVGVGLASRTVLQTRRGEFRKVPLADNSVANLNSESRVEVAMTPAIRKVTLVEGEAWFQVAKNPDRPFVVEAGDIRVQAVGTAFSVRRRAGGTDVIVTEGVVDVWSTRHPDAQRQRLTMGDAAFLSVNTTQVEVVTSPEVIERKLAWREGNIILNNETLADAVAEFNHYNGQKIVIADPAIAQARFVGQYRIDEPQNFADAVHQLLNVPTHMDGDTIVLGEKAAVTASVQGT